VGVCVTKEMKVVQMAIIQPKSTGQKADILKKETFSVGKDGIILLNTCNVFFQVQISIELKTLA
jgi:hypothetical protein